MTIITKSEGKRRLAYDQPRHEAFIRNVTEGFPHLDVEEFVTDNVATISHREEASASQITNTMMLSALDRVGIGEGQHPDWTFVAAGVLLRSLYKQASRNRSYDASQKYGDFYGLIKTLTTKGVFNPNLLRDYTREEINELATEIKPSRDSLFTYIGLKTLADRYLSKDKDGNIYELPQERFMIIAMTLMRKESPEQRLALVKEAYWALSNLYMTVATPTLTNAGKAYGQLSSCFIDSVDDSLRGIFDSNTDVATLSKSGGGIGVYLGNLRARGSDIRGFKGVSSGVIPWMKQLNNTAVSVDQLGQRNGAIAVYLDVWHADIFDFLDSKLNNGDERYRTHDLFHGVCLPDLFMEQVEKRGDWYLFDPHEVEVVMGYRLQDFYDERPGAGSFREKYDECVQSNALNKRKVPAIDVFKRIMISQLETGTPYMFYRDTANRLNPNKHTGMIYCSNLCTEIYQNMSPTIIAEETVKDGKIVITKEPGDFVVCNLSSVSLARAINDDVLERLIPIQVRMLDNVIDLNTIEVPQATLSNEKYRAIGLGTFGWHHLLALNGIRWESQEAVNTADQVYENIAYLAIKASVELAKEKGAYPAFEGSDWQTGAYFEDRGYVDAKWSELARDVSDYGLRNGYIMAVAPNASTADIAGSTEGIDPVYEKAYAKEKKNYKIPTTAPDLSAKTTWFYQSAFRLDQHWSIRQNAARQRHVDQGISFNIYVTNDVQAAELLDLHLTAWKSGLKSTYYVRSTSNEELAEMCESCQ